MSGDFPRFPELQRLLEWLAVNPGDSAPACQTDDEAVRRHLHDWSYWPGLPWRPTHYGTEL